MDADIAGRLAGLGTLGSLLLFSPSAGAYPLNPWGAQTPQGYVAVTPFLYFYNYPALYGILYGATGLGDRADLIAGAGGYVYFDGASGGGFDYVEVFPRYWLSDSVGLTLHVIYAGPGSDSYPANAVALAPEVHGVLGGDSFALTYNVGYKPWIGFGAGGGFQPGEIGALLAPEYNFSSQFSLFCEVDPSFAFGDDGGFDLVLVPGVGFALDPDQANTFSFGVQIDQVADAPDGFFTDNVSFGLWYSTGFGG